MLTMILLIFAGFILLYFGAEFLVRGSSQLALRLGIKPLVVGLTVVAFGTSAPELVVSVTSGLNGVGNMAIGNVIGSNIFNVAMILGLSAVIRPIKVHAQVLRIDVPIVVGLSLLLLFLLRDNMISRPEGILLTFGIISYITFTILYGRRHPESISAETVEKKKHESVFLEIVMVVGGMLGLVAGSDFFVKGAVQLATYLKVSEAVIGLTVVAFGTSLPELATSVVAAMRKQEDIALGNIIGSNIFNILSILGITGALIPLRGEGIIAHIDLSFMVGLVVILIPLMLRKKLLGRVEGAILIATYGAFLYLRWPR